MSAGSLSAASQRVEDVILEADRIGERVHRERMLGGAGGAEEVDLGAEREHEVVVGQRLHPVEPHLLLLQIDGGDVGLVDGDVGLVVEEIAQRMSDGRGLEQVGRDLVQERLEGVVVVLVDERRRPRRRSSASWPRRGRRSLRRGSRRAAARRRHVRSLPIAMPRSYISVGARGEETPERCGTEPGSRARRHGSLDVGRRGFSNLRSPRSGVLQARRPQH